MTRLITFIIKIINKFHGKFLSLNDKYGLNFTDKQLHFLVIGLFGFGLCLVIQPIFEWLSKRGLTIFITFIYAFSAVCVVTFAIEIGQGWAGTGDMDFKDIVSGMAGFFVFFVAYLIIYYIYRLIRKELKKTLKDDSK